MPENRDNRSARGSMLSSLSALGASQPSGPADDLPRKILGTLAAAGAALAAGASAEAGIVEYTPNVNVGFAGGDATKFTFNIPSLKNGPLKLNRYQNVTKSSRAMTFGTGPSAAFKVSLRGGHGPVAAPAAAGKQFGTIGTGTKALGARYISVGYRTPNGGGAGPNFSDQYFAFTFVDASSDTHYGWMYGSLSGDYSDLSYNLISYAYDTTPGEVITVGQVPEPSTLVTGAMAALVLGVAGVRKWKKDREAKATAV